MKKLLLPTIFVFFNTIFCYSQIEPYGCDAIQEPIEASFKTNTNFPFGQDTVSKKKKPYEIKKYNNVSFVKISKNVSSPIGNIEIVLHFSKNKEYFNTLELSSNSGYQIVSRENIAFKDANFPFKGQIKFNVSGQFIISKFIDVEFVINEAAGWTVEIFE